MCALKSYVCQGGPARACARFIHFGFYSAAVCERIRLRKAGEVKEADGGDALWASPTSTGRFRKIAENFHRKQSISNTSRVLCVSILFYKSHNSSITTEFDRRRNPGVSNRGSGVVDCTT